MSASLVSVPCWSVAFTEGGARLLFEGPMEVEGMEVEGPPRRNPIVKCAGVSTRERNLMESGYKYLHFI